MNIFYITPYSSDSPPNIGGAINDMVSRLQPDDNDFIVHIDQDAFFLLPKDRAKLESIIRENANKYDIIGTSTNRLNPLVCREQVVLEMYDETDIINHVEYARGATGGLVECKTVALVCMAFNVGYWRKIGGFDSTVRLDINFSSKARCAITKDVYVFHLYRLYNNNINNIDHLLK